MRRCCICQRAVIREDGPVLAMGGFGNPRYLCDSCEELLDTSTLSHDIEKIESAMDEIGRRMGDGNPDKVTFETVNEIMLSAAARARAIKEGEYDFALDGGEAPLAEGEFDEIPEELMETEEDKEKDRLDEEKEKRFDKIYNYFLIGACIGVALFAVWKIIEAIFLK